MEKKYLFLTLVCGIMWFFIPLFLVIVFFIIGIFSIKYVKNLRILWMSIVLVFVAIFGALIYYYIYTMPSEEMEIQFRRVQDSLIKIENNRSKDSIHYKLPSDSFPEYRSHINSQ